MIKKQNTIKKLKVEQDWLFKKIASLFDSGGSMFQEKMFIIAIAFIASVALFWLYWLKCDGTSCANIFTTEKIRSVIYVVSYLIITELSFIWICKNQKVLKEKDTFLYKFRAFMCAWVIMNFIIPLTVLIKNIPFEVVVSICNIVVTIAVIGTLVFIVGYLFYESNLFIIRYINKQRRLRK